jgi:hypothetical protein
MTDPGPITMIEIDNMPPDDFSLAERHFATLLGLPEGLVLTVPNEDGSARYFAVLKMPFRHDDCVILTRADEPVAVLHGTDCRMVRRIRKDLRYGKHSTFQYCARLIAGGSFRAVDVSALQKQPS